MAVAGSSCMVSCRMFESASVISAATRPSTPRSFMTATSRRVDKCLAVVESQTTDIHRSGRSEEHTSELQSLMRISYAVFCLKKKKQTKYKSKNDTTT